MFTKADTAVTPYTPLHPEVLIKVKTMTSWPRLWTRITFAAYLRLLNMWLSYDVLGTWIFRMGTDPVLQKRSRICYGSKCIFNSLFSLLALIY